MIKLNCAKSKGGFQNVLLSAPAGFAGGQGFKTVGHQRLPPHETAAV